MKLNKDVLVEVVSIVQSGLLCQRDVSEELRQLDLVEVDGSLSLSDDYLAQRGRK